MKPAATRILLLCLVLACSLMAVGYAAPCCGYGTSGVYAGVPSFSYSQYRNNPTPSIYGYAYAPYSSSCGACIVASFNLNNPDKSCTYQGSLPDISAYNCRFYLSNVNEYVSQKQVRKNLPCQYSTYITEDLNATHYESCSTTYMGSATAEFDVTGPKGVAKVNCRNLFAGPSSCYTSRI